MPETEDKILLTQYAHGAGCGCKIAPQVLKEILQSNIAQPDYKKLLVGNAATTTQLYLILVMGKP